MRIELLITELGYIIRRDRMYVLLSVIKRHNRHVIDQQMWYCDDVMSQAEIGYSLLTVLDAQAYYYQSMWYLPTIEYTKKPLRYLQNQT